ncbi:MAG: energy transducer TonB [Eudoraea sp.]|nr:energy transducer TonB [Eudoraea sp.]
MRIVAVIACVILGFHSGFSQNNSDKYFPREQIVLKDCSETADKNLCLYNYLGKAITEVINSKLKELRIQDDTLTTSVVFSVTNKERIDNSSIQTDISNDLLRKESYKSFESLIKKLPRFHVTNRKSEQYRSFHIFNYKYFIEKDELPYKATLVETKKKYKGGNVRELPVYPGCENLSYSETLKCFRAKTKQHISEHFKYPQEAYKNNIHGRVLISFVISNEGKISNIKTEGGAYILQQEAIRIIELLPVVHPAKHNGKPVKIPYSVPITFNLSN